LLIWHRRAGKDDVALHKTAVAAHMRVANYWHCLPMYEQARKAIWEAINPHSGRRRIDEAFPRELRARTDNSSMTIEFKNGSLWRVVGSDNPDSLVGAPPAGIVFSEWALANPSAWGYLAPILLENDGWADFITTPRGRNHVKTMLDMAKANPAQWYAEVLTPNETGFPQKRIEEQRKEYHSIFGMDAGDALIEQEYWCSFEAAILGAYYGKELVNAEREGRICHVPYDPAVPVYTAWDLGKGANMSIWFFQIVGREIHVIDYLAGEHSDGIPQISAKVDKRGYPIKLDWVPHDAKATEIGTGKTRIEQFMLAGRKPKLVPDHKEIDGINAARVTLPRCYFDADKCAAGLEALRQFRAEWDDTKKCFKETPFPDWTNHPADAFRYMAMAWREIAQPEPPKPPGRTIHELTMDEAWKYLRPTGTGIRI
jgi:phage terminase large subunit